MDVQSFFESFGRLFSREQVRHIGRYLSASGLSISAEAFAGYFLINVLGLTILLSFALLYPEGTREAINGAASVFIENQLAIIAVVFLASLAIVYFVLFTILSSILVLKAESRRRSVEASLPDFLMLVAANIKAGMPMDQAMWYAAKPEFGLLSVEVKAVIKNAFSGSSLSSALDELAERFDSKIFQRTISLVKQSSATGGEVAEVLEQTSQDARASMILRKEINASLVLYEIFVLFAAIFGTPFLLAVSTKLIAVLETAFKYIPEGRQAVTGFSFFKPMAPIVTSGEFFWFTLVAIIITGIFSSFIIGTIRTGSRSEGLKYAPLVIVGSYVVFAVVTAVLDQFFITLA